MNIIAIETSGLNGSVALLKNDVILKEYRLRRGMVHGKLLLPSLQRALKETKQRLQKTDLIAVDIGPGSYTGLRVGLAAAKTLAYALKTKLIGVSSLDAMAANIPPKAGFICPVIDAKWQQVYAAVYQPANSTGLSFRKRKAQPPYSPLTKGDAQPPTPLLPAGRQVTKGDLYLQRMTDYLALKPEELLKILLNLYRDNRENVLIFGDGLVKYQDVFSRPGLTFGPKNRWVPRAGQIGQLGYYCFLRRPKGDDPFKLLPLYLRQTEAEIKFKS